MKFDIKFRPLRLDDAQFINDLRQNEQMEGMLGGAIRPVSYERDVKWVEGLMLNDNQAIIYYAVTELDNDDIIGYTSISEIDYRNGTCFWSGIKIDQNRARKGYGTQIALKVVKHAFEELRMVRIKGECLEHHQVAINLMLKVGYVKEGLMRKTVFKNGIHNNQWLFSQTDADYEATKSKFGL